jgi:hypothetical protein
VQWKVSEGGNGHWYQCLRTTGSGEVWNTSQDAAIALGGHLATLTSQQENSWVYELSVAQNAWSGRGGPLLGGYKLPNNSFRWVTDEPWSYTSWLPGEPSSGLWEPYLNFLGPQGTTSSSATWNDTDAIMVPDPSGDQTYAYIVEWSADCNNDGIVDYGQCHDGTLPDYNGNNIPDCCERGEACLVGNYPVQWKVSDGGNGHWYAYVPTTTGLDAESAAQAAHGHLVTIASAAENGFTRELLASSGRQFAMIGFIQADNQPAPDVGWAWVTGETDAYTNWTDFGGGYGFVAPDDNPCAAHPVGVENNQCNQGLMYLDGKWDDIERGPSCAGFASSSIAVIEFDADCNNDGTVDYGQILTGQLTDTNGNGVPDTCEFSDCNLDGIADAEQVKRGQLPDYDGNNIPDCCDRGEACVVGSYPVQWRTAEGGNGHWYQATPWAAPKTWPDALASAREIGGLLACVTSAGENEWIAAHSDLHQPGCAGGSDGWHLGGYQDFTAADYSEPSGGWRWTSGEPWSYTAWLTGVPGGDRPNNYGPGGEQYLKMSELPYAPRWDDVGTGNGNTLCGAILEWSADCNNDGTVDYGQILRGELPDINHNGTPDACECIGDIYVDRAINGADLGALLAYWGPVTSSDASRACDLNGDGVVNGSDLGILLAYWGTCGN